MFRVSDLRNKDVVNALDGKKLGYIKDIDLDLHQGRIRALILPGSRSFFGLFGKNDDLVVDWTQIQKIGVDVILVEIHSFTPGVHYSAPEEPGSKNNRWMIRRD
ncbi:MAG: YlmC/YmxH family sporulation protein [Clostridiales bacterium]|nr:YlmC/YmxH family sporulation protein [Clostridiales bacterium]